MHTLKTLAATAIIGTLSALAAIPPASAEEFTWRADAYNDASNRGRYTAFLTHGVPETDNVQLRAICTTQGQVTILGYDTGHLNHGRQVVVDFYQYGQNVYSKSGFVHHGDTEEGIGGVRFDTDINDGLWVTLKRGRKISYRIRGIPRARMHLRGSSRAIEKFRGDCRAIQNASNTTGDDSYNEENDVASAPSCDAWGRVRSIDSGRPVTIRFVNRSGSHRSVMWLDYQGQPKHYKDLAAGESYTQQTYVGHPWMFTDGPGNCKEIFIPKSGGRTKYRIRFRD